MRPGQLQPPQAYHQTRTRCPRSPGSFWASETHPGLVSWSALRPLKADTGSGGHHLQAQPRSLLSPPACVPTLGSPPPCTVVLRRHHRVTRPHAVCPSLPGAQARPCQADRAAASASATQQPWVCSRPKAGQLCCRGWGVLGPRLPQRQAWAETQPTWAQSTDGTWQGSGGWVEPGPWSGWGWGSGAGHAPSPCLSPDAARGLLCRGPPASSHPEEGQVPLCPGFAPTRGLQGPHQGRVMSGPQLCSQHAHGHGWPAALGESPQDSESKHHHQNTPATDTQAYLLKVDGRPDSAQEHLKGTAAAPHNAAARAGRPRGWGCGWARPCDSAVGSHGMAPWRSTAVRHCL